MPGVFYLIDTIMKLRFLFWLYDTFGTRVEYKNALGHGDYESKRVWEFYLFGKLIAVRDYDKDYK